MEKPFFFRNGPHDLFGVLHSPATVKLQGCLILCHPFGEEKLWSHRVFVNFARKAAKRDFAVLRFDFMGHGDSSGQSEDCSIDTYLSDIEAAVAVMHYHFPNPTFIGLAGLRFGATLANLFVETHKEITQLMLWEPVIDGDRYMRELLRINLSTQLATYGKISDNREQLVKQMYAGVPANVDGYLISGKFYQECADIDLMPEDDFRSSADCLVVQIAPNMKQKDRLELVNLATKYESGQYLKIEEPPFWREIRPFCSRANNLIGNTLQWLEQQCDN